MPRTKPDTEASKPVRPRSWLRAIVMAPIEWVGRHELSVLFALFLVILATWGFVELADEVIEGGTQEFDDWAIRAMRRPDDLAIPIGPSWLHEVGRDLTALGGMAMLALMTAAVTGFLWLRRMYSALWLVLIATAGGLAGSTLLKLLFARERPALVPHLSIVMTHSFPSGHSTLSAVVYLTLGTLLGRFVSEWRLKAYFLFVALTLTALVGVIRVYLGVHYPTDVLAGWTVGLAWALLCWVVARYLQRRGAVEPEGSMDVPAENRR